MENSFLVESSKIENASFPYKTAISKANVKRNRMKSTKWTYHKERSFTSNHFIFLKILFQLRTSYKVFVCCTKNPNAHICTFCKRWSFIWRCFSPVSILKNRFYLIVDSFIKLLSNTIGKSSLNIVKYPYLSPSGNRG